MRDLRPDALAILRENGGRMNYVEFDAAFNQRAADALRGRSKFAGILWKVVESLRNDNRVDVSVIEAERGHFLDEIWLT